MDNEKINPQTKKSLYEYAKLHSYHLTDADYEIVENGTKIVLKGKTDLTDITNSAEDISYLEKILNAKYENYIILNDVHQLLFKFNDKKEE